MLEPAKRLVKRLWLQSVHARDDHRRRQMGMVDADLPPALWDASVSPAGHLLIGGRDVVELAGTYGTPLHVVDRARLRKNYVDFHESFRHHPRVEIASSYKTNPLPGVLRALHDFGASAEVISHFELWLALRLGVEPDQIVFNGPGKTQEALGLAVAKGLKLINIDNAGEAETIQRFARREGLVQPVGVRVVTSVGWSSQFGLSIREGAARDAFARIVRLDHLDPCGLHIHLGTGIKEIGIYLQAVQEVIEFSRQLTRDLGVSIRIFDLGGGFGVPTVRSFSEMDHWLMANDYPPTVMDVTGAPRLEDYGRAIAALFARDRWPAGSEPPTLIFEPGRAISSSAQALLLTVLAVKPSASGTFNVILDGGRNITMPTSYEYHEIFAASKADRRPEASYNLFGPLCHPADIVFRGKRFPRLEPGDVLAVMDAGAYFIPNQMNFSNPRPAAVMLEDGTSTLIRERESFDDIVALDPLHRGSGDAGPERADVMLGLPHTRRGGAPAPP